MENIATHGNKRQAKATDKRGSLSIEAALGISLFTTLIFSLVCIIQFVYVSSVAKNAALNTAEKISKYSCIFFKGGITSLSDKIKSKAVAAIGTEDEGFKLIEGLACTGIDAVESAAWESVCYKMMEAEIDEELSKTDGKLFDVRLSNLLGSTFFLQGNEFTICATVESDLLVPWIFGGKSIKTTVRISANAWLYGAFSGYDVSDINVWSLNQMKRGTVLNKIYGGNLPQMFPTIDIYDAKARQITAIISIDTTKKTYLDGNNLKKQIVNEAKKLKAFTEGTCEDTTVKAEDYDTKRLYVVFPENMQTEEQAKAVFDAAIECSNMGILVEFVSYQTSGE